MRLAASSVRAFAQSELICEKSTSKKISVLKEIKVGKEQTSRPTLAEIPKQIRQVHSNRLKDEHKRHPLIIAHKDLLHHAISIIVFDIGASDKAVLMNKIGPNL